MVKYKSINVYATLKKSFYLVLTKEGTYMETVKKDVLIENENLFRALVCAPIALFLLLFAPSFITSPGIVLSKVIFILLALAFFLATLAYAAYYTNEVYLGNEDNFLRNKKLFKAIGYAPLAVAFIFFTIQSMSSASHIVFNLLFILMACYFSLSSLANAAYFTNEYQAAKENNN